MTLDEALSQAVEGARVTADHMQPGCYVEHSLSRGFLRCWRVDKPEDEPNRSQCDFIADAADRAATWRVFKREEQYPPKPKLTGGWGSIRETVRASAPHPSPITVKVQMGGMRAGKTDATRNPPVADVIDLSAPPVPSVPWAKPLDPRKGGW